MDYLKNHCWCSSSHWDGQNYDCQIIVHLRSYDEHSKEDWNNIFEKKTIFSEEKYEFHMRCMENVSSIDEKSKNEFAKDNAYKDINYPKKEVLDWLYENIPDKKWCIGSDSYISDDSACSFSFFFQRKKDAMAFIKKWSKWQKPVNYRQYFKDVTKVLNLETGKYTTK